MAESNITVEIARLERQVEACERREKSLERDKKDRERVMRELARRKSEIELQMRREQEFMRTIDETIANTWREKNRIEAKRLEVQQIQTKREAAGR
jgi:hypothetical protein